MLRRVFLGLAAVLFAGGVTLAGVGNAAAADDEAAIREIWMKYAAARVAGDAEAWLALWDENGIQMPPGMPARGKDVLMNVVPKGFAATPTSSMNINPEEIVVAGDWAYSRGTYNADRTVEGKDAHIEGKFMTIFKRQDGGGWKIYRDIFNSNS